MAEVVRKYVTDKKSIYTKLSDGTLKKGDINVGIGFYVSGKLLDHYLFDLENNVFPNNDRKQDFIDEASKLDYEKPGGQMAFFSHENPLKLELSSIVDKANPAFKNKGEVVLEDELKLLDDKDLDLKNNNYR